MCKLVFIGRLDLSVPERTRRRASSTSRRRRATRFCVRRQNTPCRVHSPFDICSRYFHYYFLTKYENLKTHTRHVDGVFCCYGMGTSTKFVFLFRPRLLTICSSLVFKSDSIGRSRMFNRRQSDYQNNANITQIKQIKRLIIVG